MGARYVVTAGHVTAETNAGAGRAELDFFRGQVLPGDVPAERIATLLGLGRIAEVKPEPAPVAEQANDVPPPGDPADPDAMPLGMSVSATLTWAGSDKARAQVALDSETGPDGQNRSTLVDRLGKVLAAE